MTIQSKTQRPVQRPSWLYHSLDAAVTASLHGENRRIRLLRDLLGPRSSRYRRVSALVRLCDRLLPGFCSRISALLLNRKGFPIHDWHVNLLAYGLGGTVFLLRRGEERMVIKIYRRTLGKPARAAYKVAREFQEKYVHLRDRFNRHHEIVIPSTYLVLHSPLLGANSAAVLQPFVQGQIRDLFVDYTDEDVVALARHDRVFRDQLLDFIQQVFAMIDETGACFDLAGKDNLMLVETEQGVRLKIADIGMMDLAALKGRCSACLDRLLVIQQKLERRPGEEL